MAPDIYPIGKLCHPGVCGQHVGDVYAHVVDGLDDVEGVHGNLSGGFGLPVSDDTGAVFLVEEVLQECLEGCQAQVCDYVRFSRQFRGAAFAC